MSKPTGEDYLGALYDEMIKNLQYIESVAPARPGDGSSPIEPGELVELTITGQALLDLRAILRKAGAL